jgi:Caspase domain
MNIFRMFFVLMMVGTSILPLTSEAIPTRRLGLMIGANDGGKDRVRLQYAASDAKSFSHSMEELGGLDPKDRILLENPDSLGISQALDRLALKTREAKLGNGRVEVVIFYSGHADEQGLMLKGKHFGFPEFRAKVDKVPADVRIAIVDACASGALTRLKGGRALPAFLSDESSQTTGYAFLTSSSADEAAQESDRIGASFFSHYMNTGLRGAADASQDGRVTLHEAYQYAYNETLARTEKTAGGPQHAGYDMRIAGTGDVVMTELSRAEASLALPDSVSGRFSYATHKID